ncbi:thrombospondin type 3 repeat-containing protein [Candidatus Kaiserbacteria bacterium]|nr:thrombospondin type 3 repeat-containing protein [Candidatus Kaiserbacteria bacterium]
MIDRDVTSYTEFPAGQNTAERTVLTLHTIEPVTTSALTLTLPPHVAQPLTVAVRVGMTATALTPIVVERRYAGNTIQFPEVTGQVFEVTLTHIQPLRIADIQVIPRTSVNAVNRTVALRFLAQPGSSYELFAHPDRMIPLQLPESGNLVGEQNILPLKPITLAYNPQYMPADIDNDSVPDTLDNCVTQYNPDQTDIDKNGRGDVCDDYDRDGVINEIDNCINQPNVGQADEDGDGIGDMCDSEESRFTEKNPWIPWVGIGLAGLTILALFALVALGPKPAAPTDTPPQE